MYEINTHYLGIQNIFLLLALFLIVTFTIYTSKKFTKLKTQNNIAGRSIIMVEIILIVIMLIINITSISERVYIINCYKHHNYNSVTGVVNNFNYIYAHNSYIVTGVSFDVENVSFEINKGNLNYGYSVKDNVITENGEYVIIDYLNESTILKIEK